MIVPAVTESLLPAGRTFPDSPGDAGSVPSPTVMAAGGADEAVGPALGCEMPSAGGYIGKARLEGGAGHRAVVLPASWASQNIEVEAFRRWQPQTQHVVKPGSEG